MAVPIVTAIDPASGPSMGGNMVEFTGINFSLPVPTSPPGPGPTPDVPSVTVTFDGIPAVVAVVSSTRMFVTAPKFSLIASDGKPLTTAAVAVEITNLDAAGVPIPGEVLNIPGAYTYGRVDLSSENESDLSRMVRTFVRLWKSEVVEGVVLDTDSDYDDFLATINTAEATLPGIALLGPTLMENSFQRDMENPSDVPLGNPGEQLTKRYMAVDDLHFDVIGYSDNEGEFINLLAVAREFVDRNVDISMLCDPSAPDAGLLTYEMEYVSGGRFSVLSQTGTTQNSNLHVFRGQMKIVGFAATGLAGVKRDRAITVTADTDEQGALLQLDRFPGDTAFVNPAQSRRSPPPGGNC